MSLVLGKRLQPDSSLWVADTRIALAISCISLVVYGWLMLLLKSHHVLSQDNIVFDADPPSRLAQLAHGWGDHSLAHPLLPYMFSVFFRMATALFLKLHLASNPIQLRESIAIWVAPVCSAIKVGLAYVIGRMIGASRGGSLGLALLAGFSLTPALFGSLPEHHALSGLVLTATFGWATAVRLGLIRDHYSVWLALTFLATAVTVTNVVMVLIIYLASRLSRSHEWPRVFAAAALLGTISTATAIGLSIVGARALKESVPINATVSFTSAYTQHPNVQRALHYPVVLATSLMGSYPAAMPNESALTPRAKRAHELNVQFSYDILPVSAWTWVRTTLILGVAAVGLWYGWRDIRFRRITIAAVLVLVYNGVFHTLWGSEWLLYSVHWHSALLMLLAGWLVGSKSRGATVLLTFGIISAADATVVIREMLLVLERVARSGPS